MQTVGQKIGPFLQISSCAFNEVDVARAESHVRHGWFRSDAPNLVGGVYRHSDFATDEFHQANLAGKMVVLGDTHHDSRIANPTSYDAINMRSFVSVPFIAGGVWKYLLAVTDSKPREWRADEVELIRELCNRIFPRLERANAEAALRGSEPRFRAAVSAVSSLIWTANAGGEMEGEQPGWRGFTGQTRGELQGHGWAQAVHPDDAQPTLDAWKKAVSEKRMFELEHRVRRHDGAWRVCSVRAVPVNETGEVREWVGVHTDITERKQAHRRLRRLIDSNVQGVIFWNQQGEITEANDAFLRIVGYTRDDLAAGLISWAAMTPPEYVQQDQRALAEIAATGVCTPIEKEYIRKDGTRVPILAGGASLDDNANEGVSFVLDITTLKHAETALLAAHQQQRVLSRRLLEVQETERRQIARDLHDELGQILTAVKINLQTIQPAADGPLAPSVALVDRALQQTRSLSLALRPPLLDDLGLVPALRWLVD
ncbi:MAG: PAS domain S-box protein [Undibacterium sp.]|nr:PAS domain S-box protein [Opitutaceae bacterium]